MCLGAPFDHTLVVVEYNSVIEAKKSGECQVSGRP